MLAGGMPCTAAIFLFMQLMAARAAGRPVGADGLGIMMLSLVAYAIALLSCGAGLVYFGFVRIKYHRLPQAWDWLGIVYSLGQVALPVLYFAVT